MFSRFYISSSNCPEEICCKKKLDYLRKNYSRTIGIISSLSLKKIQIGNLSSNL